MKYEITKKASATLSGKKTYEKNKLKNWSSKEKQIKLDNLDRKIERKPKCTLCMKMEL